ncbi:MULTISPECIES: S41 family peptidase [unclassified Leeuwenhoekiella]|uniref:S41 family peptidase n=1 Tax=unclassified Leeuwenhoekiella TaxID=2615029 RepID=UPI000C644D4C|nr:MULTISPECIES: S41 family peptidase [unclassified Leeuwenhoekiella]MAW94744.1 peptidase S41 [Leeuwenhoekiella sp.]MAW95519.1 peptidase S41 [Leeuwenhoekiella sp.]MBA82167.1 peptidase S41 [Leeuwenhoekiella sp.]
MKKNLLILMLGLLVFSGCSKDDDTSNNFMGETPEEETPEEETPALAREDFPIQDFMYQAMNVYYLYKSDIPELADTFFNTVPEYVEYLSQNPDPDVFFYDELLSEQDRFSFLTDDYQELENSFSGVSKSNGLKFQLVRFSNTNNIFGYVRYVAGNSPAADSEIKRGDLFTEIDGTPLTIDNYQSLIGRDSYTLTLATIVENAEGGRTVTQTGETVTLTKETNFAENPILIAKTLDVEGQKIGYLMYNSFVSQYDDELNSAFAQFKADGITDLVLDLRYNGGGSVATAIDLTSMITGQFDGEVLIKEQWNAEAMAYFESEEPESLLNRFNSTIYTGTSEEQPINSLNLNRLYVIGTESTASASELTVIGLEPYIPVTLVGTTTVGKFQASATLYDGDNFGKNNLNPEHKYAIQPLIYTYSNADGTVGPPTGLTPDVTKEEDIANLGVLGEPTEPLLASALQAITGKSFVSKNRKKPFDIPVKTVGESDMFSPTFQKMYDNNLPVIKK